MRKVNNMGMAVAVQFGLLFLSCLDLDDHERHFEYFQVMLCRLSGL
ncbi:hypothetical protein [Metabacillus litoralis]|nr:hypothetical protein [Metabacillus litoralis]MCM3412007.1 hypothetical protein [Metabacillus litoralis]